MPTHSNSAHISSSQSSTASGSAVGGRAGSVTVGTRTLREEVVWHLTARTRSVCPFEAANWAVALTSERALVVELTLV